MTHIFISYSKKDTRELALSLSDALNAVADLTCWVDRSLRAGRNWELQIEREIDRCDIMVVLYSEDLHRHKRGEKESYVLNEIGYAKNFANKRIIPVMAQTTQPPLSLINDHYIDYVGLGLTLTELIEAICAEAGISYRPKRETSLDLMPPPFAWIDIPAGRVTLEDHMGTHDVPAFQIAKYPITNAQFAKFIEAGGYDTQDWWTEAGWGERQKEGWMEPRYWRGQQWNGSEQPVVGVSWYEAQAFCRWLSTLTGEQVMLPNEQHWQRAAQGDDGRTYPWGNEWDCQLCNNSVLPCASNQTTPVTQYEVKGDSPFGVVDMSGNVWEWITSHAQYTLNIFNQDFAVGELRGGSHNTDTADAFRTAYRTQYVPYRGGNNTGFRVSRAYSA